MRIECYVCKKKKDKKVLSLIKEPLVLSYYVCTKHIIKKSVSYKKRKRARLIEGKLKVGKT